MSVRNPLLAYADSYRQMAEMGDGKVHCLSVACDIERNMAPHARPVPGEVAVRAVIAKMRLAAERSEAGKLTVFDPDAWASELEAALRHGAG